VAEFKLNSNLLQVAFDQLKLEKDTKYFIKYPSFKEFKTFIRDTLKNAFQNLANWNSVEFLTLCALFQFETEIKELSRSINSETDMYNLFKKNSSDRKPTKGMTIEDIENIKFNLFQIFYFKKQPRLESLLKSEGLNLNESLTPLQWLKLTEKTIPPRGKSYSSDNYSSDDVYDKRKISDKNKNFLLAHSELKEYILFQHYGLDEKKAREGIFPIEMYSLQEALKYLDLSADNLLARCFMDKIGVYCKQSNYIRKKYQVHPVDYETLDISYKYFHVGLERLSDIDTSFGDSPVKRLCYSETIQLKTGDHYLIVPIKPSLAEICQGITSKHICLQPQPQLASLNPPLYFQPLQQISRNDIYFLKSDIDALKDIYHSGRSQGAELSASLLKDLELGVKTREKNKKFAQIAIKKKKLKAKEKWDESLNCALSIARAKPHHHSANGLAMRVVSRLAENKKSIPGELDTFRKKIIQNKSIAKYLKQMKRTETA